MATDILESLRSDVRREPLVCLAAAQEIDFDEGGVRQGQA